MSEPIKIGNLNDPHERLRLELAVAQALCCPDGCKTEGLACEAGKHRERARRDLANAPIVSAPKP